MYWWISLFAVIILTICVCFIIYWVVKGIIEVNKLCERKSARIISEHLEEYMAHKESIGEGADNEKLLKKFEEIAKKEHEK